MTFTVRTRSPETRARAGTLHLAHGDVQTPAFVPLATKGAVKTLEPRDVAALGYELILGNTFHLLLSPGPELVARMGGLNEFIRWKRPIITDSGGFQVFSMGHGTVADEIKGRRGAAGERDGAILSIEEGGVRFRSYVDRLAPERPRHLLGIGEVDDLIAGVRRGIDTFDCAMPTRLGRHGMALIPDPAARWRVDLAKSTFRESPEPILDGCPCPACAGGY